CIGLADFDASLVGSAEPAGVIPGTVVVGCVEGDLTGVGDGAGAGAGITVADEGVADRAATVAVTRRAISFSTRVNSTLRAADVARTPLFSGVSPLAGGGAGPER